MRKIFGVKHKIPKIYWSRLTKYLYIWFELLNINIKTQSRFCNLGFCYNWKIQEVQHNNKRHRIQNDTKGRQLLDKSCTTNSTINPIIPAHHPEWRRPSLGRCMMNLGGMSTRSISKDIKARQVSI